MGFLAEHDCLLIEMAWALGQRFKSEEWELQLTGPLM